MGPSADAPIERIALSDSDVEILSNPDTFEGNQISVLSRPYTLIELAGKGYKGVVWKVQDQYRVNFALKIAIGEDYEGGSIHDELELRARLPMPAFTKSIGADYWSTDAIPDRRFVVTVEDWIEGITLERFLEQEADSVTMDTVHHFGQGICAALLALQANELVHDDLHAGNVMLRKLLPGEGMSYGTAGNRVWTVVVVDTGSLKRATLARKDRDDLRWAAEHLVALNNRLRKRPGLTQAELRYSRYVFDVVEQMLEQPDRGLRKADQLFDELEKAFTLAMTPPPRSKLASPFDFLSAERIADDELLIRLFTEVPWMGQVASPDPVLLTGPRGCGKSMLFRWLALKTHLVNDHAVPDVAKNMTGVYISCTTELQNRFLGLHAQESALKHQADIVHYFNLLLARELLLTLDLIQRHPKQANSYGLGGSQERAVLEFVTERIAQTSANIVGTSPLRIAIAAVEKAMFESHMRLLRGEQPQGTTTGISFLGELTDLLTRSVVGFTDRPIVFLLDDFSTHRVPEHVQRVLGPVVWERRASHVFKISSEKNGVIFDYQEGATADASRERFEIDCGKEYLTRPGKSIDRFARDLLAKRLEMAGWAGTPEQLIGESPKYSEWIQDLADPGKSPKYYGMRTISELCSGDIATLLTIYRRILMTCSPSQVKQVTANDQNRAITEVSREALLNLVPQRPHGDKMFEIANAFGHFAGRAVGRTKPIGGKPRECPRIEVDQGPEAATKLDENQQSLVNELIRRSVFIELESSRSRRDHVPTMRLHIRRIYMPAFRGPLRKNVALKYTPSRFERFLSNPKQALASDFAAIQNDDDTLKYEDDE